MYAGFEVYQNAEVNGGMTLELKLNRDGSSSSQKYDAVNLVLDENKPYFSPVSKAALTSLEQQGASSTFLKFSRSAAVDDYGFGKFTAVNFAHAMDKHFFVDGVHLTVPDVMLLQYNYHTWHSSSDIWRFGSTFCRRNPTSNSDALWCTTIQGTHMIKIGREVISMTS
mmetsp:Transcript_2645/g.5610  ORF Transcript_2645/g.5610 Transcript_2645/m.5610 type:complete len:168 (-) Transcript_2645:540-1043(-)